MTSLWIIWLFQIERRKKRALQAVADFVLLLASFVLAMLLRLEDLTFIADARIWAWFLPVVALTMLTFISLGFYRTVIRYISPQSLRIAFVGVIGSVAALSGVSVLFAVPVPLSVPFLYGLLSLIFICGIRYSMRSMYLWSKIRGKERVIIYGAGESGRQLFASLVHGPEYAPVCFVDDSSELQGISVNGRKVYRPSDLEQLIHRYSVKTVLLAIPSASSAVRRKILERLEPLCIQVRMIPGMSDIVSGKAELTELREVAIEDLLGRDPVPPRADLMSANIRGKVVMVTGAGGSIGAELCRQIVLSRPKALVLFELSEFALFEIERLLNVMVTSLNLKTRIIPVLGSVQNHARVTSVLRSFGVQTLYHAAAYKHVPLVEYNVVEGIRNNVFGTLTLAQAAVQARVESFTLISTDKAVRPTNIMGASKRMAELICQSFATKTSATRFSSVRFGNVMGSSGSVIPEFRKQISNGGPMTVSHPDITRYFMTILEAAQLVIQAGAMARGGDVFLLDMGRPVKIVDLAERMARLCGLEPVVYPPGQKHEEQLAGRIAVVFTGLRPGEKLFEELLVTKDATATDHPRIMTATEAALEKTVLGALIARLDSACDAYDIPKIQMILHEAATGYNAVGDPSDLVWSESDDAVAEFENDAVAAYPGFLRIV